MQDLMLFAQSFVFRGRDRDALAELLKNANTFFNMFADRCKLIFKKKYPSFGIAKKSYLGIIQAKE